MTISNFVELLSGIALFLFGMLLMGDGLKNVAGSRLELILYKLTGTPLKGVLLGTGVTAVIQSSSATSVMVVGFVNSGMMKVKQAIGIVLGAILGTSITGWIICLSEFSGGSGLVELFSTATLTGVVAVVGIVLRMFCKNRTTQQVGNILMGFAVLMTGITAMSSSVAPLRESAAFIRVLTSFSNPFLGILVGLLFTCVLQSASAAVGILQALAVTGAISFGVALPIIMGIAIGAAVPVLLSAIGASVNGKRTAFVYLLIDTLGVAVIAAVFYTLNSFLHFSFTSVVLNSIGIALLNTLFRFLTVLLLLPFIGLLEKIVCTLFKEDPEDAEESAEIDRLEERFLQHPAIALEQSNHAVCSMARKARKNLARSFALLGNFSEEGYKKVQNKEQIIDRYEDKLGTYLVKLTGAELTTVQSRMISRFLHTIGDFERIGDHAVNIANTARELHEKKLVFSKYAQDDLAVLLSAVSEIVIITTDAFEENNLNKAKRVEPLEEVIDSMCDRIKLRHIRRVQGGDCTLDHGFAFNDLLNNCERVADHCSNIAVAMIELAQDEFDTHAYLNSLKQAHTESFDRYYKEYDQRFAIAE